MELLQFSSPDTVTGIFALIIFLYALFKIYRGGVGARHRKRLPPEVGGALPLIGHLHLLAKNEPAHKTFAKMADAYGPIFTLRLGLYTNLIVSNWEIARECFTTNDKIFASRPKLVASKLLGYDYAMFGLSPYGPHWRHVRKLAMLELLSNYRLEKLQHIRVSEVQTSMKNLYELCLKNKKNALVEMKTWFGDITLNTISRIVVGKKFSTAVDASNNENEEYRKALRDFFEWFGVFVPSDSFPFLKWLDLGGHEKAMKKTAKVLDEVFDKWIQDHKNNLGEVKMEEHDFMDVMLSNVRDDGQLSKYDAHTVTKATCLSLILAGSDTTTVTMIWALSLLLNNQEVLKRAQLELDERVGRQRQVKESDVKNLLYLQAIVKETLRLYPAAPILVPHESVDDCVVAGYHIPVGTRLIVNVQKLQRDPQIWEDPCEFRPERFLTSAKDFDVRGQNPRLIPFGSGRRMCPGISFALQVMHLALANLLHGFEISRPSKEFLDMEESAGMTSIRKNPLEVVLTPRLPPHVYE
ncbi:cytochrome P450 CYP82D47-like [Cucumis melo var. makuwa]|uniref:Cytochrome P450 CYP82D47-like n=2 Tax=Cucumis melo TaxID=3656 RepID=A0A5A7SU10_CUCMM|nr:cytochrome P450 CYP82D47-like [Cucumis melo var. makuwa]TYJ98756.1 cytochrome P450 CYP82D47-like [Cucumis melo var. makuwa]